MLKIKTVLKLAPSTHDEEFSRRKKEMKDLGAALHNYRSAMDKAKASIKRVVEAFADVRRAFSELADDPSIPDCTKDCTLAFSASMDRLTASVLPEYNNAMDGNVVSATNELKTLYEECGRLESDRSKVMNEYDVYRNEVAKKESEYQRKSKDLSTSKTYSGELAKRDKLEADFETADRKFNDTHDYLMQNRAVTCTNALNAFMTCTSSFMQNVASEFEGLKTSAENALEVVRTGAHAEYDGDHE